MASRGRSNFTAKVSKYRRFDTDFEGENDGQDRGEPSYKSRLFGDDPEEDEEAQATSKRFSEIEERNGFDEQFGFVHYASGPAKTGWIVNMKSVIKENLFFMLICYRLLSRILSGLVVEVL